MEKLLLKMMNPFFLKFDENHQPTEARKTSVEPKKENTENFAKTHTHIVKLQEKQE